MKTATELELEDDLQADDEASKPAEQQPETIAERVERELASLRELGFLKKPLPTITRSTFSQLPPRTQADFCKAGGKLCDDPAPERKPIPAGAITRSEFDAMVPGAQTKFIRGGGKLVDDADVAKGPAGQRGSELDEIKRKLKISAS